MSQHSSLTGIRPGAPSSSRSSEGARLEIERLQSELSMQENRSEPPRPKSGRGQDHLHGSPSNDEIDLLDLMRTLWNLRYFALGGSIIGALVALTVLPLVVKTRYITTFPLEVDIASLPAVSEPEKLLNALNGQFGTGTADQVFEARVLEAFPDLKAFSAANSEDASGETRSLFAGRFARNLKDLPVSIEKGIGNNQYLLSVNLPARVDNRGQLQSTMLSALNSLVESANTRAEDLHNATAQAAFDDAMKLEDSTTGLLESYRRAHEGLVKTSGSIQALELRLMELSKKLSPDSRAYLREFQPEEKVTREDQLGSIPSSHNLIYKDASKSLSRSFASLALLSDQKAVSTEQEKSMRTTLLDLQGKLDDEYSQVQTQSRLTEVAKSRISEALRKRSEPVDRQASFLPHFLMPEGPASSSEILQKAKPSRAMTLALSVLLCGMVGLMVGFAVTILPGALQARAEATRPR